MTPRQSTRLVMSFVVVVVVVFLAIFYLFFDYSDPKLKGRSLSIDSVRCAGSYSEIASSSSSSNTASGGVDRKKKKLWP